MKEGRSFTWLNKFSAVIDRLKTEEEQAELALAIIKYGAYGYEPYFDNMPYPLEALFEALREDIDNAIIEE